MQRQRTIIVAVFVVFWVVLGAVGFWMYTQGRIQEAYICAVIFALDVIALPIVLMKMTQGGADGGPG